MVTVPVIRALHVLRSLERLGHPALDLERLRAAVHLQQTVLHDPAGRVPRATLDAMWEEAARQTGDPDIGLHVGERAVPEHYGALGYAVLSSPHMRGAFEQLESYASALLQGEELELLSDGRTARFVYRTLDGHRPSRHRVETFLVVMLRLSIRALAHPSDRPREVRFIHPRPSTGSSEHERVFGAKVLFGQADNEALFDADLLDRPFPRYEPALHEVLQQNLQVAAELYRSAQTVAGRVRHALNARAARGEFSTAQIARELGMSERTLQRRLAKERRTLSGIVDEWRHGLALRHLESEAASIPDIAVQLGFGSTAAFYRAFARWTGETPARFRKSQRG